MAIDELLLNEGLAKQASLRFYQWSEPTVSLGHFQSREPMQVPLRFTGLPVVRRLSGGGAILHDQELTYSCVLPVSHPVSRNPSQLYDLIHSAIIEVLARQRVLCRMRGEDAFPDQFFLCFSRGDARDLVIGSQKIVGSAQRRRQGVVLQHGSLLLKTSQWTDEFPGIQELTGVTLTTDQLIPALTTEVCQRLNFEPFNSELTESEIESLQLINY